MHYLILGNSLYGILNVYFEVYRGKMMEQISYRRKFITTLWMTAVCVVLMIFVWITGIELLLIELCQLQV